MLKFNLLPDKYQDSFKQEIFSRMFLITAVFVVLWAIIFSTTLVAGVAFLTIQNNALEDRVASMKSLDEAEEAELIEQEILELNSLLSRVAMIKKESSPDPVIFLNEISSLMPPGAHIINYSFDAKTNIILINGSAESLAQFNILESNLEESPLFDKENIESPLSNFVDPTNFKLTIPIKETNK